MSMTGTGSSGAMDSTNIPLSDAVEFHGALQQLLGKARRHLRIYSQGLARPLYNTPDTIDRLSEFARSSRYARVQILITDSDPLLSRPHRILPLLQRLGSRIELKKIQPSTEPTTWEFAIADRGLVLFRADQEKWQGHYDSNDPVGVRKLQDVFEQAWLHALPDPELKRFLL
ncbi:hypothetical protein [Microbulbifer hydrolyticus]|uniref:DUF7931 domain-containing protein n=1 Tax=Microbulbifer hydrolyticus TaxID=48074 RepID=A0A6P1T8M9_9GAMM|nr:hypothetical protein [Microbulbifer hydrolyticus]MBB5210365.1 hypothetical protein [Microbulbifer hydrolyticus]QHQ39144.1 hypothetical protein GTQ55_09210 [Microbulbifer hydrolyticus]